MDPTTKTITFPELSGVCSKLAKENVIEATLGYARELETIVPNPRKLKTIAFIQDSSVSKRVEFRLARLGWIVISPNDLSCKWEKANKGRTEIK